MKTQINDEEQKKRIVTGVSIIAVVIITAFFMFKNMYKKETKVVEKVPITAIETPKDIIEDINLDMIETAEEDDYSIQTSRGEDFLELVLSKEVDTYQRSDFDGICIPSIYDGVESFYRYEKQKLKNITNFETNVYAEEPLTIDYLITVSDADDYHREFHRLIFNEEGLVTGWHEGK